MKLKTRIITLLLALAFVMMAFVPTVLADTNGNEIKISDEPDKLILQLGSQWIGVEFELKTDAGVFPVPVVVDSNGILKMDLGGSKTYTLSCIASTVAVPDPEQTEIPGTPLPEPTEPAVDNELDQSSQSDDAGIPTGVLVMFVVGLVAAVVGLIVMRYMKYRRESYVYDDDDDEYE